MNPIEVKDRLHGARLAAGFVYVKDAALALGIREATYRHAETGKRSAGHAILVQAARVFGVSSSYFENGTANTQIEMLGLRLADLFGRVDVDQYASPAGYAAVLERLRKIRTVSGHLTTNAAAEAHGWNRTVYWQHETGGRGMTIDRLIAYCLSMDARPEYGVLGHEPVMDPSKQHWSEQDRVRPDASSESSAAPHP